MARREQYARIDRLRHLLGRPEGASLSELERELGVVRRTLYRDIETLESCGTPIVEDDSDVPKRLRIDRRYQEPRSLMLSPDEILVLAVLTKDLAREAGPLSASARSLMDKVRSVVAQKALDRQHAVAAVVGAVPRPVRAKDTAEELHATLLRAIDEGRELLLSYNSASGRPGPRRVEPRGLATRGDRLYLVARDVLRGEDRRYLTDRIAAARPTSRTFARPVAFDAEAFFAGSFGVHGGPTATVIVRFDTKVALFVKERRWHSTQVIEDLPGGDLILTMTTSGLPEVKSWVQSFGDKARVLAPRTLADEVRGEALRVGTAGVRGVAAGAASREKARPARKAFEKRKQRA